MLLAACYAQTHRSVTADMVVYLECQLVRTL